MKKVTDDGTRRQDGQLGAPSDSPGEMLAELRRQTALIERQVIAQEEFFKFLRSYAQIEAATRPPLTQKRKRRTKTEVSRIVYDAIQMVDRTGWSDRRIARELNVPRSVFVEDKDYLSARLEADRKFSQADPDARVDE